MNKLGLIKKMEHKRNIADMMAILADFEQSHDCCKILLEGSYNDKMRLRRALYESAFISFRRALKNGSTRRPEFGNSLWKFEADNHKEAINGLNDEKDEILKIADKCIAHRAMEEARKVEFPKDEGTGEKIARTRYRERLDLIPHLRDITKGYIDLLLKKLIPYELIASGQIDLKTKK